MGFTDFVVPLVGGTRVLLVFSVPFFSRRAILPEVFTWSRDLLTWGGLDRFGDVCPGVDTPGLPCDLGFSTVLDI